MSELYRFQLDRVGVVVIGRNEGERLRRCLVSALAERPALVVYVDSGSTDSSVKFAQSLGVEVVELDMRIPFSAARGRNAGFERVRAILPDITWVQFVDGDCELRPGWLAVAISELASDEALAIVAGWLRERAPEVSIYNRIGDLEWNFSGIGEIDWVGGIFMVRADSFAGVGGFDPGVAAGEEPELCARLRRKGFRVKRLNAEMATHDLAMTRFSQWWRRMLRFGYGSLDVASRFDLAQFRHANLRARGWGLWLVLVVGLFVAVAFHPSMPLFLMLSGWLLLWPAQCLRIAFRTSQRNIPFGLAGAYAFFVLLSNFPHLLGQVWCWWDRRRGRGYRLVEHKNSNASVGASMAMGKTK